MHRIRLLDVLRGFAIIGTLGTNIWIFADLGSLEAMFSNSDAPWWTNPDHIIATVVSLLVNGKFLGMLTIMFGVGLELKRRKAARLGQTWPGLYLWTSFLLLVDGFLHYLLVMEYDILMSYAVTAMIVAFIVERGTQAIKRTMIAFGILHVLMISSLFTLLAITNPLHSDTSIADPVALYQYGTWVEQIQYRYDHFWSYRIEAIGILPMNIFLFLFGVMLMRSGAFAPDEKGRAIRRKMLRWGLGLGLPLNLLIFVPGGFFILPVRYLFAPILSMGYTLIAKIMEVSWFSSLMARFEEIGKTALSCYMLQNIIASFIFYGWGLGLGSTYGSLFTVGMWLLISVLLMAFSHGWLRIFPTGPVEWVWRRLSELPVKKRQI
ncbi:DUF418 domain-containing protein [Laceyella putida]|uniref:DUF418 domain-containing protein n=1 Tax=Laceyella putida TaxID=110101 RepID=A0ABW2RM88_9BACL